MDGDLMMEWERYNNPRDYEREFEQQCEAYDCEEDDYRL